jgi:hypothetical protein
MKYIFELLFYAVIGTLVSSCTSLRVDKYEIPSTITVDHRTAMNEKFKSKGDVFEAFGAADKKDSFEGTEVWTYNLAQRTMGNGTTSTQSKGTIKQNQNNAILPPISRSVVVSSNSKTNEQYSSTTMNDYISFWFRKDSVVKWESLGYDASFTKPNPEFDQADFDNYIEHKNKQKKFVIIPILGIVSVKVIYDFIRH